MENQKNGINIPVILTAGFSVSLFIAIRLMLTYSFIFADDTLIGWTHGIQRLFAQGSQVHVISALENNLFGFFLPYVLKMHPSFFKSQYFCYIESGLLLFAVFITSRILEKEKTMLFFSSFFFCAAALFFIFQIQPYTLFVYDGMFRMLQSVFFWVILFGLLNKYKDSEDIPARSVPLITLFSLLSALANEFTCVATIVGLFLLLGLGILAHKNNNCLKNLKLSVVFLAALFGCAVLVFYGVFTRTADEGTYTIQYFSSLVPLFPEFAREYFKYVICNHWLGLSLLIFQTLLLLKKTSNGNEAVNSLRLIFSFLFGIFVFFALLFALGKTHYFPGAFWIVHYDLHLIYSVMLLVFNLALLKELTRQNIFKRTFVVILLIVCALRLFVLNYLFYKDYTEGEIARLRLLTYKSEKIIRYANRKGKLPLLPLEVRLNNFCWGFFHNDETSDDAEIIYNPSYVSYLNSFPFLGEKIVRGIAFSTDEEKINEEFRKNGGGFSREELENINFNNLLPQD